MGAPSSSSLVTISRAAIRQRASISHTDEEKNRHAAWKETFEATPAPASMPTTLRSPVASTVNRVKVPRRRNTGRKGSSSADHDAGKVIEAAYRNTGRLARRRAGSLPGIQGRDRHHGRRARKPRPEDQDRRHPADPRQRQTRLATPRRPRRELPRPVLLRRRPPVTPQSAIADPAAALPGIIRPVGHRDLPLQQR